MKGTITMGLAAVAAMALGGCAMSDKGAPFEPLLAGKADVEERIDRRGALALTGAVAEATDELTEDFELHGYTLAVSAGARIDAEITQRGTARGLDTTLFVYGPLREVGAPERRAFDDDGGWGLLSRVEGVVLPESGHYLVIVGSQDGLGRGRYRLEVSCADDACASEAPRGCPPEAEHWLNHCAQQVLWDAEFEIPRDAALEACVSEPELVRETYDAPCDVRHPPLWCLAGFAEYERAILPACNELLRPRYAPPPEPDLVLERVEVSDALLSVIDVDDGNDETHVSVRAYRSEDPDAAIADVVEAVRQATGEPSWFRTEEAPGDFAFYPPYYGLDADEVIAALVREAGSDAYALGRLRTIHPDHWDDVFVFAFDNGAVLALRLATYR